MNNKTFYPECYYKADTNLSKETILNSIKTGKLIVGRATFWDNENRLLWVTLPNGFEGVIPEDELSIVNLKYPDGNSSLMPIQAQILLGKTVCARALAINDENTVLLSRKQIQEQALKTFEIGKKFNVLVTKITPYGVFAEIAVGIPAIIPIKEISSTKFLNISDERIRTGKVIPAVILSFNTSSSSGLGIFLSYKRALRSPVYQPDDTILGIVRLPLKDKSGYFVEITPLLSGIVDTESPNGSLRELPYGSTILCTIKGIKYITDSYGEIQQQYKLQLVN